MNLTDRKYTELIERFDDWYDMVNIVATFRHLGLAGDISPDEYLKAIDALQIAKARYPSLPLNEAYAAHIAGPQSEIIRSQGLGDTVAKFTHATGLDKLSGLYSRITGKDCGCSQRQDALNRLVPYGTKETP